MAVGIEKNSMLVVSFPTFNLPAIAFDFSLSSSPLGERGDEEVTLTSSSSLLRIYWRCQHLSGGVVSPNTNP